ncbi:MAG TPA: DUF1801 domain-containing protein [Candidatus Limnocylindrales bacterium]|nr:DUF1801 domain-containing protein [Candidatus Limnocylindrales bacterium]
MKDDKKTARRTSAKDDASGKFTDEEREAMKERARELKAARAGKADGEGDLLAKIAELPQPDRALAERIHAIVRGAAPDLAPRTWYGMPAWSREGKVLCFFTPASKFKERYSTFGFNANANLDEGNMWPTSWALTDLTEAEEARIAELVKKAVG